MRCPALLLVIPTVALARMARLAIVPVVTLALMLALPMKATARAPSPVAATAPVCSASAAQRAVKRSSFGRWIRRASSRYLLRGRIFRAWVVDTLYCRDLTGDDVTDMVVVLAPRGALSFAPPTPLAVYQGTAEGFRLRYRRVRFVGARTAIDTNRDLAYTWPRYRRADALCCPSSYLFRAAHWNGSRFITLHPRSGPIDQASGRQPSPLGLMPDE